jgi:hypothetical protein
MTKIRVTGPHKANQAGTCNACDEQITEDGTDPLAVVYEVTLRRLAFRLCVACARRLRDAIEDI